MTTDARSRGADSGLPFGAGLRSGEVEARPTSLAGRQDEAGAPARPGAKSPPGLEPKPLDLGGLGAFMAEVDGAPLQSGAAGELTQALSDAFGHESVKADLLEAMGPAASDARFRPSLDDVAAARLAAQAPTPPSAGSIAVVVQPSESFASLAGRILCALEEAPRVGLIGHSELPHLGSSVVGSLVGAGLDSTRLTWFNGQAEEAVRLLASIPSTTLDLIDFDPVEGVVQDRLLRLREIAGRATEPAEGDASADDLGWFGLGAVDRPPMPIRFRPRSKRQLHLGPPPADGGPSLPSHDLAEAAEQVVEQAFGRGALGGFADDALASVVVQPRLLSSFTACLLETLLEADSDPWFQPPPWVLRRPQGPALRDVASGRRLALDEGATLIHERSHGGAALSGLVFTNVEPRMKVAGEVSVPGTLTLSRALEGASSR